MRINKIKNRIKKIMVFIICVLLTFNSVVGFGECKSPYNKHFVKFGIDKVWANPVNITIPAVSARSGGEYGSSVSISGNSINDINYNKASGALTVKYNITYEARIQGDTYNHAYAYIFALSSNSPDYGPEIFSVYQGGSHGYYSAGTNQPREVTVNIGANATWVRFEVRADTSGSPTPSIRYTGYYYFNQNPSITVTTPTPNGTFSEVAGFNAISLQGTVSDPNAGDVISTKYNIDGGATQTVSGTVTTSGSFTTTSINVAGLTEGNHNLNIWCVDNQGAASSTTTIPFKVDKTLPTASNNVTSTTNSITISGSATDAIAGLAAYPYRYTVSGSNPTSWVTTSSFTKDALQANTQYVATFEARDSVGHIASKSQDIYTKAEVPTASVNNPSSFGMKVNISDNNPTATQYMIGVNSNTQYVTPEGTLTSSPVWITLPDKSIIVRGLTPETTYTFQVKAKNGDNVETAWSSPVSGTTLISPPGSPANIIATATDSTITLSWNAVSGSTGYEVEADGAVADTDTRTAYTHTGLNPGTPHTYRIRAINEGGPGSWSAPIEKSTLPGSPGVPGNLSAVPLSTTITVTWDNVPGATGYDIEVDGALVTNGPNTNYRHTSLMPGTSHTYRVKSINPGGKSEWSSLITVTTLVDSSPVPVNINTTAGKNQITVTWDAVDGATGYEIEADGVRIDNNTRISYSHTNLQPGTEHWYRVRSEKGAILSDWSAMTIETTLTDSFGVPENILATADDTSVLLIWDPVTDAVGYDVQIDGEVSDVGMNNSLIIEGLAPDTDHTYRVRVRSEMETSDWSEAFEVTTYTLPTPRNLTATVSENSISTVWEEVYGADTYDLEFDGSIIPDIEDCGYTIDGLEPGNKYVIKVRGKNDRGTSNWSAPIMESIIAAGYDNPSLYALAMKNQIILKWNQVSNAESYDLDIDGVIMESLFDTTYKHEGLLAGTQHSYRIRVRDNSGPKEWSDTFTAHTLAETPPIPTNIAASSNMTSILITWDKVNGVEGYEIEVDGVVIDNGTSSSYLHNSLIPESAHNYRVRAKNAGGYSSWSEAVTQNTLSSIQTFTVDCKSGDELDLMLSAANIQELNGYSFTVNYNVGDFDVLDLCSLTPRIDTSTGNITGTDIKVTQYEPGTVVFTKTGSAQNYEL